MPEIENYTPFPNLRYYSNDNSGKEFGVLIVKATYAIAASGRLLISEQQDPINFDDKYHGEPNKTSLWKPSDLVPNKPNTDIVLDAVTRAPSGQPSSDWRCGLAINDTDDKTLLMKPLRVMGPRQWVPRWKRALSDDEKLEWQRHRADFDRWELSSPEVVTELPLRYEYAFGGSKPVGLDGHEIPKQHFESRNPLGCGRLDSDWSDHTMPHTAPQIENPADPIVEPFKDYVPQCLGPIPPAWEPRLPLAGTYDKHWLDNVWPKWATDYQFSYHNSANADLICKGHLQGNERISLLNLLPGKKWALIDLPNHKIDILMIAQDGSQDRKPMALDTVFLCLSSPKRRERYLTLTWRLNFEPDLYKTLRVRGAVPAVDVDEVRQSIKRKLKMEASL